MRLRLRSNLERAPWPRRGANARARAFTPGGRTEVRGAREEGTDEGARIRGLSCVRAS